MLTELLPEQGLFCFTNYFNLKYFDHILIDCETLEHQRPAHQFPAGIMGILNLESKNIKNTAGDTFTYRKTIHIFDSI